MNGLTAKRMSSMFVSILLALLGIAGAAQAATYTVNDTADAAL